MFIRCELSQNILGISVNDICVLQSEFAGLMHSDSFGVARRMTVNFNL